MSFLKKPGASLLVVGLLLFFVVAPIVGALPAVGGLLQFVAWVIGVFGIVGGGYLVVRSIKGPGGAN